jgi:hypothetical protein
MENTCRKQCIQTSFFVSFAGSFPLQFYTCIPIQFQFLFLFLRFAILQIKEDRYGQMQQSVVENKRLAAVEQVLC